jgi:hypothetical protein
MDVISKGHFNRFIEDFELENIPEKESDNFEKFCFYSIIGNEYPSINEDDLNNINTEKNKGIDGIAVLLDGRLITNTIELKGFVKSNKKITEANIVFIQSKTSATFEDSEIGNFCDTVKDFLQETPLHQMTSKVKEYHKILLQLYANPSIIKYFKCKLFYCTTGTWNKNTTCSTTLAIKQDEITNLNIFEEVDIKPIDSLTLRKLYDKVTNPLKAEFSFDSKTELKNILNVQEAYIGNLPFTEFKKIIIDEETQKIKNLFYDNVRDDLGDTEDVNEKINKTLKDKEFSIFPLLNNGVTIIAEKNEGRGSRFVLDNYQIVNGCQTSNILFRNKELPDIDSLIVPIKLIITDNESLRDKIIISTNSQTKIKEEQLLALTEFQKGLEEFYEYSKDGIYYERRTSQYSANLNIKKKCIVNIREQIKSYVAMFLDAPDAVSGYFGKVYKDRKDEIFIKEHKYDPYYVSGFTQYKFKQFIKLGEIDRKYNKARYHALLLFRKIVQPENSIDSKSKKIHKYCEKFLTILRNKNKCLNSFKKAIDIIKKSDIDIDNQKEIYKKSTTTTLIKAFNKRYK